MNSAQRPPMLVGDPVVDAVLDTVHVARGFDLGNVVKLATREGAVVIDTTSSRSAAATARDALAEASPGETSYLVYTHCHNDHTSGAESLVSSSTRDVVAHELLEELTERDHGCLGRWTSRHRAHQRGRPFDEPFVDRGYVAPTLTFADTLDLEVGGLTVHLEHTEGETRDHLLVWVPELGVLCPGDLIYPAFPNLSTPVIGPRPIQGWIRSLERFLELEPEHLVGSHGPPVSGRDAVREVLTSYRDAIQYVWDASVRAIDDGVDVHTAARTIALPDHLATHPWLRPIYGTVNWGVRAVYDGLTGWYDLRASSLDPLPRPVVHAALAEAAGPAAIVARAEEALEAGDAQLALELVEVVLDAHPDDPRAAAVEQAACRARREGATSANERGFYHSALVQSRRRTTSGA